MQTSHSVQDMLSVVVTLNRCMYAQLEQQEFGAPSCFSMPPAKSAQHSAAQRGMKLSCGLEMLYARSTPAEVQLFMSAVSPDCLVAKVYRKLQSLQNCLCPRCAVWRLFIVHAGR